MRHGSVRGFDHFGKNRHSRILPRAVPVEHRLQAIALVSGFLIRFVGLRVERRKWSMILNFRMPISQVDKLERPSKVGTFY